MSAPMIRFVLNGRIVETAVTDPTRTVLQFLREDLRLTGTKEGCAEGDCGACTVVIAEVDNSGSGANFRSINSCIQFLPTIDGKELITARVAACTPCNRPWSTITAPSAGFARPGL
jgi:xanthine dehydrogenase small subunit